MLARGQIIFLFIGALMLSLPFLSSAAQMDADAMCLPYVKQECGCGMELKGTPPKCMPGPNKLMCPCSDTTSGFTTSGKCVATFKCQAMSTSDGKLDQGMAKLGEMLGKLMEMMKKQEGGGGSGGGSPTTDPYAGMGCTTMQPTGTKSLADQNPMCYYYDSRMDPTVQNPTTDPNAIDPSGGLVATPTDGAAPLNVVFAFTNGTSGCGTPTLLIDFGDGKSEQQPTRSGTTCSGMQETAQHTYSTAGQYAARLKSASTGEVRGGVNITVGAGTATTNENPQPNSTTGTSVNTGGGSTEGSNTGGTLFTGTSISNLGKTLFNTPLNTLGESGTVSSGGTGTSNGGSLTGTSVSTGGGTQEGAALNFNTPQTIVQSIIQKNLPPGAYGDVKILANGTTIIAGVREKNSEIAGFYGTTATTGASGVAKLCSNRPWASNFLSFIIPATFFDSLCSWRGYAVGKAAVTPPTPAPTTSTFKPTTVKTTVGGTKTGTATTTPAVEARVDIWASPSTVPLGARTSIFWNTQGVTECIETSPDGSFSHTSLKGGASTVPLTSATTFTISCIAPNGAPVTDSITVQMAL